MAERYRDIFDHCQPDPLQTSNRIAVLLNENFQLEEVSQVVAQSTQQIQNHVSWVPPPQGVLKFNTDIAWQADKNLAAIAVVVRNFCGKIIDGGAKQFRCDSPLAGEAFTALEAMKLAKDIGAQSFIGQSDSKVVISALNESGASPPWEIKSIILAIKAIVVFVPPIAFVHVKRLANRAADYIAKLCSRGSLPCNRLFYLPCELIPMHVMMPRGLLLDSAILWHLKKKKDSP
ncbi:uncharacterized protein LOC131181360 [Hevea brasiliensis]|uniref:uncharacterized protein LOC131181360 n=1 Tax=Hevea brasiliensis TaxID=3981 RepID=UPI0025EF1881|nr:uncharacterized protein LOC131181360 [Hevea brasiliensis]